MTITSTTQWQSVDNKNISLQSVQHSQPLCAGLVKKEIIALGILKSTHVPQVPALYGG